jgi:aspartyl-tRNA(Asn)/glutamyl-tRNA(Gln) amidotransferase subunit B
MSCLEAEVQRQIKVLESCETLTTTTRSYDPEKQATVFLRTKDTSTDYRYMPDPELPAVFISPETIQHLLETMPELPEATRRRLESEHDLSTPLASILVDHDAVTYFKQTSSLCPDVQGKTVANWIVNTLFGELADRNSDMSQGISPTQLASLISAIHSGDVLQHEGKKYIQRMLDARPASPTITDLMSHQPSLAPLNLLKNHVRDLAMENQQGLNQLRRESKVAVMTWFAGNTMRRAKGRAQPDMLRQALHDVLVDELDVPADVFTTWIKSDTKKKAK